MSYCNHRSIGRQFSNCRIFSDPNSQKTKTLSCNSGKMPVKPCYNIRRGDVLKERANRLYELRKSRNLTQSAVVYQLNLSLSRIYTYENGEHIPCDALRKFADFYGVSIDYILCFSDDKSGGFTTSLRRSEQKLLDMYRNLTPYAKALIDGTVSTIYCQKA